MLKLIAKLALPLGMVVAVGLLSGCPGGGPSGGPSGGGTTLELWHTRRRDQEKVLQAICQEYEKRTPGIKINPVYQGSYDELNKKVRASIQARSLPALAVGYESHVTEYMQNDIIRPLDDLVKDPELGLKPEELADIPEQYLESNRFKQFGGQLLSFPFTKSNLVLYHNLTLMKEAGFERPPATWAEFEKQAAAITAKTGKPAFAFDLDPSTMDGMIYSFGGELLTDDNKTLFDQAPTVQVLSLLKRMEKARTLRLTNGDDAATAFLSGEVAFNLASSASRAAAEKEIGNDFMWDVTIIPHGENMKPATVMFGPNICVFKATPEQEKEAWKFIRFCASPEISGRWARETGYLPTRKSAVELPEMKTFYETNPRAQHVYQVSEFAKGEPNVLGWQEVRDLLRDTMRAVITTGITPEAAAADLKKKADQRLQQSR